MNAPVVVDAVDSLWPSMSASAVIPAGSEAKCRFGLNTILCLEHFSDPAFRELIHGAFPHLAHQWPNFPTSREQAKMWEVSQCIRAFGELGVLRPDAELLGVGAGYEITVFLLTQHVKRVFATDLYATNEIWNEANRRMLAHPEEFVPDLVAWDRNRLVVQHMDALDLRFVDNSLDGVFSCGSIEHFGSLTNVARSAREIGRVLKPGGVLALATECRISGPADGEGIPGALIFTPAMIDEYIVKPSGLRRVDRPMMQTSAATLECVYPLSDAIREPRDRSIALSHDGYRWTSGFVCLAKPA
jgi:SAM-dependent methyltransferase